MTEHVHHWLEMKTYNGKVIALCNSEPHKCHERREFTFVEWEQTAVNGHAKNKPVRV